METREKKRGNKTTISSQETKQTHTKTRKPK